MIQNIKRWGSALLILCMVLTVLPAKALAAEAEVALTIIHVNDRHGRMGADPHISELAENTRGNVLILDAGDALHGQITANLTEGAAMIELMNEVGYSAMALGNHEFTYGTDRISELAELADFPILAANVIGADGQNLFQSRTVFVMDGITVGVFGLATPETIASSDPRLLAGLTFADPVETAITEVAELKAKGCDVIIALIHLGIDNLSETKDRSDNLAANVPGIDVIIDGHSHTELENGLTVGNTLIAQTGEYGKNIGVVEIMATGGKTAKLIPVDADALAGDRAVIAKIADLEKANEAVTGIVVGHTPVLLQGEKTLSRIGGTNLADLVTDSILWATGADMAFVSGGNIRASINDGDITMGEVLTTLPYSNILTTVELTGADILKVLEHGVDMYPEAVGHYIHLSGLLVTFDPEAEAGSRVKTVRMSDGSAFLPHKVYTVATIDFIAVGGDGYDIMQNGKNLKYYGGDVEAFVNYLAAGPIISAEAEGRLQVSATAPFNAAGHWAAAYIEECYKYGLMHLYAGRSFNPEASVTVNEANNLLTQIRPESNILFNGDGLLTREVLAGMLEQLFINLNLPEATQEPEYEDIGSIGNDYRGAVVYAYKTGLMRGVGGNRFDPKCVVTRAQMAAVLINAKNAGLSETDGASS